MPEVQPQKKINTEAERLKSSLTLPDPPANRCKWEQAKAYFDLLTNEQWEQVQTYVYRTKPIISKPRPFYIDLIGGRLEYDNIVALHGGGEYRLDVQDTGRSKKIMEVSLSVPMTIPPKLDLAELDMNEPKNKAYINQQIAEGKLSRDGTPMTPNSPAPGVQTVPEAMAKMQADFMNIFMRMNESQQKQLMEAASKKDELGGTVGNILIEKMKQDNPNNFMTVLVEMLKQQKSTAGDFAPMFTLMQTMMVQMATMQQENTKMLIEVLRENKPTKSDDDDEMGKGSIFDKMKSLLDFAKELKGGKAAEKSTLETIMDGVQVVGPPLLQTVGQYLQFAMMSKSGAVAGMQGMPQAEMPSMPNALPAANTPGDIYRNGPPKVVSIQPQQQTQPTQGVPPVQLTPVQQVQQLITSQGPLIFAHLENSGAEFADLVVGMYGKLAWVTMSKFDIDTMIAGAKMVPQWWQQVEATYGEERLRKWIEEFKNYEEILAKQEAEEEGEES